MLAGDDVIALLPRIDCVMLVTAVGISSVAEVEECNKFLRSDESRADGGQQGSGFKQRVLLLRSYVGVGSMRLVLAFMVLIGLCWQVEAQALQPGDTLAISVYQDPKLDRQVVVGPTGMISFPLAGQIKAEGMTPPDLEKTLRTRLKAKYTGTLDITVSLIATNKIDDEHKPRFFVTGEVNKPGPYLLRSGTSVVQAIAMAGGLGQFAARKRIQVRRKTNGIESNVRFRLFRIRSRQRREWQRRFDCGRRDHRAREGISGVSHGVGWGGGVVSIRGMLLPGRHLRWALRRPARLLPIGAHAPSFGRAPRSATIARCCPRLREKPTVLSASSFSTRLRAIQRSLSASTPTSAIAR